jgi:HemY protein
MRTLVASIVGLLAAVALTLWVKQDNGYFLIGYGHWSIEGSLALLLLTVLLICLLVYLLVRTLSRLWHLPDRLHDWQGRRRASRARHSLTQGLVELAEGNWKAAQTHLISHAHQSETPLLNYLAAARAAHLQGEDAQRDDYLKLAHASMPTADVAVGLTQADLQLDHQQNEQALATLNHLRRIAPKHTHVLMLLKRLYLNLQDWDQLEQLLPELLKRKAVSQQEFQELEVRVYQKRMAAMHKDAEALQQLWERMPKGLRQRLPFLKTYASYLVGLGAGDGIAGQIAEFLTRQWDAELVRLYGRIKTADAASRLTAAEGWLKGHPEDPDLLLTLARLCLQAQLWGKARSYLEASIGILPKVEAYQELGLLLEQLGESDKALECFRTGLGLERRQTARPLADPSANHPALRPRPATSSVIEGV